MDELFDFLTHERLDVRNEAVKIVSGLTADSDNYPAFEQRQFKAVVGLMECAKDDPVRKMDIY